MQGIPIQRRSNGPSSPGYGQQPATDYGNAWKQEVPPPPPYVANPYEATTPSAYNQPAPYNPSPMPPYMPPQPPVPPVQPRKRGNTVFFIIGGILLAFLVLCGGGVYLLTAASNTISNQDRKTTPVATSSAATPTAAVQVQNPYPPRTGTLIMNDPMHDNSKGYKWDEATMKESALCGYKLGNYHLTKSAADLLICNPEAPQFTLANVAFEANLSILQGHEAGLIARFDQIKGVGYIVSVAIDGRYVIDTMDLNNTNVNKRYTLLRGGTNAAIKRGLNQNNLIALIANESSISLFINNQFVDSAQDTTFKSGQIGVYGYGDKTLDVVVQNARVWRL